jgi:putative AlgH/UPF0301 family transcriptional regulator
MAARSSSLDLSTAGTLAGQLLIAMPRMNDPRFARSVVYLCAHSREGAMGLVINKLLDSLSFLTTTCATARCRCATASRSAPRSTS